MARPELVDNRPANTHGDALDSLARDERPEHGLSAATGYVNLAGLRHLALATDDGRAVRLLLGAAPASHRESSPFEVFNDYFAELHHDRSMAGFPPSRAARDLGNVLDWLRRPNVQVRRYLKQFLHGKAYLFGDVEESRAALVTSANLTAAGLFGNLELGLAHYQPNVTKAALEWFDALWNEAPDFKDELVELLGTAALHLADPWMVFLRALLELFGDDPADTVAQPGKVNLAAFQWDGYLRALQIVKKHHGVIYADGVGTGKTEIGLAFMEEYALRKGQMALVIVPAQLKAEWKRRIDQAGLPGQVVSYHELAADEQLAPEGVPNRGRNLHLDKDTYRLVLADEGHSFRNPETNWYRALSRLMGGEQKDLVLLTATPINNGLWDLYHLVMAFARHDRAFAGHRIRSLRKLFLDAGANEREPENLNPDALFKLADLVSVRRDRRFIEERYPGATFPDGTPVRFPIPELTTARYNLDAAYPGLVAEITGAIEELKMARYRPSTYRSGGDESASELGLAGLLRSGILKRFESCWDACRRTVARIVEAHELFLAGWKEGFVLGGEALRAAAKMEMEGAGLAESLAEGFAEDDRTPVSDFDPAYEKDVARDLQVLRRVANRLDRLSADGDPKIETLLDLIENSPSRKVIVFSTFADTIRYLDEHLPEVIADRERITVIGAETDPDQRTRMLAQFCPKTVVREDYEPEDGEVDVLLSNDVLSEGQNLQQAAAVISYDMPWNPQRVVQRYGRVIRLKSDHERVFLTTMLPAPGDLEPILKLEQAIRRKMSSASVYGMEVQVLEDGPSDAKAFADRLVGADPSILDETDPVDPGQALSGEGLRAELTRWLHEMGVERLRNLPWGTGAVFRRQPDSPQAESGWFFACRTRSGDRYWRWVSSDGTTEPEPDAAILRRIHPRRAPGLEEPSDGLESAWRAAVDSIVAEHNELAEVDDTGDSIGPLQSWALDAILGDPEVALPDGAEQAADVLSVGRGSIVRRSLGQIRRRVAAKEISKSQAAVEIVELVQSEGLRPVDPPERPEPISESDVGVVCWMEILPAGD